MTRVLIAVLAAAGLTALSGLSVAHAQREMPSAANVKAFTDQRIDVVKAALQLTPAQEKLWPAVEDAIRARANARYERLARLAAYAKEDRERNPIEILRARADATIQRGASLKKLVDAWQPLYESLEPAQRVRLRVLSMYVLREMRDARSSRWESEYEEEEEE